MRYFGDLFSGCGGLSLGLQRSGWTLRFAIEANQDAFATYCANIIDRPEAPVDWLEDIPLRTHDVVGFLEDHRSTLRRLRGSLDVLAGGPPCQGFSTNGQRRPDDPRNTLVLTYLDIVRIVKPPIVLIENVRGFSSTHHNSGYTYLEFVRQRLQQLGYDTWSQLLYASDWGIPQRRPRFFLIAIHAGLLVGINPFERLLTLRPSFLAARQLPSSRPVSAGEAIHDLCSTHTRLIPDPEFGHLGFQCIDYDSQSTSTDYGKYMRDGFSGSPSDMRIPQHTDRVRSRFTDILKTCKRGTRISPADRKRLGLKKRSTTPMSADLPSPTITTLPDDIIHYDEPRVLTVRENARLQSFPDWFSFEGPYTTGGKRRRHTCPRYTQVGNAVPPLLSEAIGEMLAGLLEPL